MTHSGSPGPTSGSRCRKDVHVAVLVEVEQSDMVVGSTSGAERPAREQVLVQPLLRLAEVEELDLLAVLLDGVIDQLDDLLALDPAVADGRRG